MNNLSILLFIVFITCIAIPSFAQEYLITDGETTTTCGGTFYDSGGAAGNYDNNESIVHTFCPDDPTDCMLFDFESLETESDFLGALDFLDVYDGNSTAAPLIESLGGDFSTVSFPIASTTGCVTFEFFSDFSNTEAGWEAAISCIPCPAEPDVTQQDCIGAIPVCGEFYFQPNSYSGEGIHTGEVSDEFSCLSGEKNSVWYVFNAQETGNLSFLISPVEPCDDYDWAIWDITGVKCSDILPDNGLAPLVSCNYSNSRQHNVNTGCGISNGTSTIIGNCISLVDGGQTGAFSAAPYNGSGNSAVNTACPYNEDVPVEEGHTYALNVSNFSASQSGYFLDLRPSSAVLVDTRPPEIANVKMPLQCWDLPITFEFSEPVLCNSIQGADFQITQPDGTFIDFAEPNSNQCTSAETTNEITFFNAPRITQTGMHIVTIIDEIEDNCGNIGTNTFFEFYVETIDVDGGDNVTFCNGEAPTAELGGNPTSAMATQYSWTSDPPSAMSFLANNDVANPDFINPETMPIGTYSFFVEATILGDSSNPNSACTAKDTISVTVENCGCNLTITNINSTQAECNFATGEAMVSTSGGTAPLTYNWEDTADPGVTVSSTNPAVGLSAGTFSVTVTDFFDCEAIETVEVADLSGPILSNLSSVPATCNMSDGQVAVEVTGSGAYTFEWVNTMNPGVILSTTNPATGLPTGNYTVTAANLDGTCPLSLSVFLNEDPTTCCNISVDDTEIENATCGMSNGIITLTVSSSNSISSIEWEDINNLGVIIELGSVVSDLPEGTYRFTITDNSACTFTDNITITGTGSPVVLGIQTTNSTCGNADGEVTLLVGEGLEPYIYNWENTMNPGVSVSTSETPMGLVAGTYVVTVTDANACFVTDNASVNDEGGPIISDVLVADATCGVATGSVVITVTGGTLPYVYNWENITNPDISIGTSDVVTDLSEGTYTVVVTDAGGCSAFQSVTITDTEGLTFETTSIDPSCGESNGSAAVLAMGGTYYYTYLWSNGSMTEVALNLPAGTHTVTVTDTDGCSGIAEIILADSESISFDVVAAPAMCNGSNDGAITIENVSGGIAPYEYSIDTIYTTDTIFTNLTTGTYTVSVRDDNGCLSTRQVTLTDLGNMIFEATTTDATCSGSLDGSITIQNIVGGTMPYMYAIDGSNFMSDSIFTNLQEGTYVVAVQDADGCEFAISVVVSSSSTLTMDYGDEVNIEFGESVDLFPVTNFPLDTSVYTWTWTQDSTLIFNDLSYNPTAQPNTTTTYTATATDDNDCTVTDQITIRVRQNRDAYIPNIFSPNFDGENDVFMVYGGIGVNQVSSMQIFDRWGNIVYENTNFATDDPAQAWDGTHRGRELNPGAYVYYIVIDFIDGTTDSYRGDVTLVK